MVVLKRDLTEAPSKVLASAESGQLDLTAVQCPNCKQVFDLSYNGTFPVHSIVLPDVRIRCSTSNTVFAKVPPHATKPHATQQQECSTAAVSAVSAPAPQPNKRKLQPKKAPSRPILQPRRGKVKCPICDEWIRALQAKQQITEHGHDDEGRMCKGSYIYYTLPSTKTADREARIQSTFEKYRLRDLETVRRERERQEKEEHREKRAKNLTKAELEKREERRQRYREQRLSDHYAMYAVDSFGEEDDGFEPHQRERVWRGGLPGLGRR